ncbi:DMBT1 protein, partial [Jacana jacana]|nr:DMBT1 protein [Jacana jacana]
CSGRVEAHHSQQWRTVCDDGWDPRDAEVACRQLGCKVALSAPGSAQVAVAALGSAHFGQGRHPVWLDEVNFTGTQFGLSEFGYKPKGVHKCHHREDAGVVCSGSRSSAGVVCSGPAPQGDHSLYLCISGPTKVRLVNGSSCCSGRVEVLHNQRWGSVCDDSWDLDDVQVV